MIGDAHRYLGFAFASADLLFEVRPPNLITFAMGAGAEISGGPESDLCGRPCTALFDLRDTVLVEALLAGLEPGERRGPISVRLAHRKAGREVPATFSACRLPQLDPFISCALSVRAPAAALAPDTEDGLYPSADFEALAGRVIEGARGGQAPIDLALIELGGLSSAAARMAPAEAARLLSLAAAAIRAESLGGSAAARLGSEHFAVLRQAGESPDRLARRLARVLSLAAADLTPSVRNQTVDPSDAQSIKVIRHAVEVFLTEDAGSDTPMNRLGRSVQATLAQAGAFRAMVDDRRFELAFQPVVDLNTGATSHYESLVRFERDRSPYAIIRMAEELDMIEKLDMAVTEQVVRRLTADTTGALRLAVNVSGRTIVSDAFVKYAVAEAGPACKGRLLFELTESAGIEDFEAANRNIQQLRASGFAVGLDDFGAGAASFDYLRRLSVDLVKIDGRYISDMVAESRAAALVRHVVELCRELKVKTVAEMVETREVEVVLKQAGVDFGQGWLYGAAEGLPVKPAPVAARRQGVKEQWG